ncbi:MAG TPA: histidinol dehydrogenase [bacterium]|nr:histidinol dehydrogenase [bacterium]HOL47304.1 histidinol dehydrogenase [bacterium]HPQ17641.1 histidinol dehydrogenase [bacterium]
MIKIVNYKKEKRIINEYFNKRNILNNVLPQQIKLVEKIINEVKNKGDKALLEFAKKFDKVDLKKLKVSEKDIDLAYDKIEKSDNEFIKSSEIAINNIKRFHSLSLRNSMFDINSQDVLLGEIVRPIAKAGIYVPGGSAPLISTLFMNVIPAQIAGVPEIVIITPPEKNGKINEYILAAAKMLNINQIYISGGAQAIAALAYGTETIPKVDKITGPGNIYVTLAKKFVYGIVDIDMLAGPSELVIIAEDKINDRYIAGDLISQAEHGSGLETSIAILFSKEKAKKVIEELKIIIDEMPRKKEILISLKNNGWIIIVNNMKEAIELTNIIAPEHLELLLENPDQYLNEIKNAGAIFLGEYTPEAIGDYIAGPNHTLPTTGTARFYSPLSVKDFLKTMNVIKYNEKAFNEISSSVIKLAEIETLFAHSKSVKIRLNKE